MINRIQLRLNPEDIHNESLIRKKIVENTKTDEPFQYRFIKRSIDARARKIKLQCTVDIYINEPIPLQSDNYKSFKTNPDKSVTIIGAGPAGLFAALYAISKGVKPVIIERGKKVRNRRRDLAELNKKGIVNPESNYCFGEGGAGTYSDGKLYTRSKKRGDVHTVLSWFVHFGADEDILIDTHPHIGTNKLPKIIEKMREEIIMQGGEIHFNSKMTDLIINNEKIEGIIVNESDKLYTSNLILATGHSARDVLYILNNHEIKLEAKPFALGVRVEHKQELIDKIQYWGRKSDDYLPPASYSLVAQVDDVGVYSFCMCPGGIIAPCATSTGEVVTNGWSPSKRNNPYANAGIVMTIDPEKLNKNQEKDPFVGLEFQQNIEKKCWELAGKTQQVPAQCLSDFMGDLKSKDFPRSSYIPGIKSVLFHEIFPSFMINRFKKAFTIFNQKMPGFLTNDAVLHAPESRTSSPVKIPRNKISFESTQIRGLYPCGEGAGYAGGIVSAAIDGINCMKKIIEKNDFN